MRSQNADCGSRTGGPGQGEFLPMRGSERVGMFGLRASAADASLNMTEVKIERHKRFGAAARVGTCRNLIIRAGSCTRAAAVISAALDRVNRERDRIFRARKIPVEVFHMAKSLC
jgi:hypothetical protein